MKHAASSAFFELKRLKVRQNGANKPLPVGVAQAEMSKIYRLCKMEQRGTVATRS